MSSLKMLVCHYNEYYRDSDERSVPVSSFLLIIICIFGVIGNLVAIFVILVLKEHRKSVTHWYILQLAWADTVFLAFLPFKILESFCRSWILPEWMCKCSEALLFLNFYSSTLFLMVMSIDRYIAVCHPFSTTLQAFRRHRSAIIITCTTWCISILLCVPVILSTFVIGNTDVIPSCTCQYDFSVLNLNTPTCRGKVVNGTCAMQHPRCTNSEELSALGFGSGSGSGSWSDFDSASVSDLATDAVKTENDHDSDADPFAVPAGNIHSYCIVRNHPDSQLAFVAFNFSVMFLLPLLVMIFCYGMIIMRLTTTQMKPSRMSSTSSEYPLKKRKSSSSSSRSDASRRRVTVMCATLVSSFAVCWLPFHAFKLGEWVGIAGTKGADCQRMRVVGTLLAFLNSALNPYLYTFLGTNFSKRLGSASTTVIGLLRRRNSSTSAFVAAKPSRKRKERCTASNNTKVTRFFKTSSVKQHSQDTSQHDSKH